LKIEAKILESRVERLKKAMKAAGLKTTRQRLEIFREVAGKDVHPDVKTIFGKLKKRMPSISMDTVYRTLWMFVDLGVVDHIASASEGVMFDARMDPHHHFRCGSCGKITDFRCDELSCLALPGIAAHIGRAEKAQVEIKGICFDCLNKKPNEPATARKKEKK